MNSYIDKVLTHLSEREPQIGPMTGEDMLEELWFYYLETASVEPQEIQDVFLEIDHTLHPLPWKDAEHIRNLTNRLCYVYQRISFLDGLTLGTQFAQALENHAAFPPT